VAQEGLGQGELPGGEIQQLAGDRRPPGPQIQGQVTAAPLVRVTNPIAAPAGQVGLHLDHVGFGYQGGQAVLDDVSLTVPAGLTTAVVGRTGAGKSTLLSLLVRLHNPDSGVIRLGDVDIAQMTLDDVRDRFAFVPQDAWMMAGTIGDNVRYGTAAATDEQVRAVCAEALVDEFTDRLPLGLGTPVAEGGLLLSGGQLRRIALARALLRGSPVLLLDGPTSGLDATSEAVVVEAITRASAGRTVLIVTHHLALAERADQVVVLGGGQVVQCGSPSTLRRDIDGHYAQLLSSQRRAAAPQTPDRALRAAPPCRPRDPERRRHDMSTNFETEKPETAEAPEAAELND